MPCGDPPICPRCGRTRGSCCVSKDSWYEGSWSINGPPGQHIADAMTRLAKAMEAWNTRSNTEAPIELEEKFTEKELNEAM